VIEHTDGREHGDQTALGGGLQGELVGDGLVHALQQARHHDQELRLVRLGGWRNREIRRNVRYIGPGGAVSLERNRGNPEVTCLEVVLEVADARVHQRRPTAKREQLGRPEKRGGNR
jgi:hypothetical protein